MKKSVIFFILILFNGIFFQTFCQTTWGQVTPAGTTAKNWATAAINSDGTTVIAGIYGKRLYISPDGGSNWSETQPAGDFDKNWKTTSISSNGTIIIAGVYDGRLYLSLNGGTSWSEIAPHGENADKYWQTTAMSSDGSRIIAGIEGGRLYISTDSGETWDETTPEGNTSKSWYTSAMNGDGSKIIAGVWEGWLHISTDGGSSWDVTDPIPDDEEKNKFWSSASMSSDGSTIVAAIYNDRMLLSDDIGNSWTETQPAGDENYAWNTTAISGDGNYILAGIFEGYAYLSTNGGNSWTQQEIGVSSIMRWATSSISLDGSKAIIGSSPSGRLYMTTSPLPVELISFTGKLIDENHVLLEWQTATEVNNFGFDVERRSSSLTEWEKVGFVQGHGTTNSPKNYEFTDSELPNSDEVSYRLKQIDNDGTFAYSKTITVDLTTITSVDDEVIYKFALEQNYPNPFNPSTTFEFTVPSDVKSQTSDVKLIVYDILGREVATLVNQKIHSGNYEVKFEARNLSSGMYFYRIDIEDRYSATKKMILLR